MFLQAHWMLLLVRIVVCMESAGLGSMCFIVVQSVLHGEMHLEVVPVLVQDVVFLPFLAIVVVNTCVENESICNVYGLMVPIWLVSCLRICSSILHLLVEAFNRATEIIWENHALAVVRKLMGEMKAYHSSR
jgi:hypothetical protein